MSSAAVSQPPGQPQLKAPSTAQLSVSLEQQVDNVAPTRSDAAEAVKVKVPRTVKEARNNDFTSLPTTLALIQRVLAPDKPIVDETYVSLSTIEEILPPLTSSNEIDVELYAILAIIVKDFVNTWYTKITPDHTFVEEIIQIFAHCSRELEQRLRQLDTTALLLDEVPLLLQHHVDGQKQGDKYFEKLTMVQCIEMQEQHSSLHPTPSQYTSSSTINVHIQLCLRFLIRLIPFPYRNRQRTKKTTGNSWCRVH